MSHTTKDKIDLLHRVRRLRGQVTAIEKALEEEQDCSIVLQRVATCRGAINSLMAEILEGHVRHHILDPKRKPKTDRSRAAQELIDVVNTYLK